MSERRSAFIGDHAVISLQAPADGKMAEGLCACGFKANDQVSIGAAFRAIEAHRSHVEVRVI